MKKITSYLILFSLFFNNVSYAVHQSDTELGYGNSENINPVQFVDSYIDAILEEIRPNRTNPWFRTDSRGNLIQYHEYYISGEDLACGFRSFGYNNRIEAIDDMISALNNSDFDLRKKNKLKEYISNSICNESEENLNNIFSSNYINNNLEVFSRKKDNQIAFLKHFKKPNVEIPLLQHFDLNGNPIENDKKYELIDAFAILKNVNLFVYTPKDIQTKELVLIHSVAVPGSSQNLFLIYNRQHFNKLVLSSNQSAIMDALLDEEKQLNITIKSFENARLSSFLPISPEALINPTSESEEEQIPMPADHVDSDESNVSSHIFLPENGTSSQASPAFPQVSAHVVPESINLPSFDREQILIFIKNPSLRLRNLGRIDSCKAAYRFLKDKDDLESRCGLVRLALDHHFYPEDKTSKEFYQELLNSMKSLNGYNSKIKHYIRIYIGKLHVQLGELRQAWDIFSILNQKYTQTFKVDMAEMIIDHGFIPRGYNQAEAYRHAEEILDDLYKKGKNDKAKNQYSLEKEKKIADILPPNYLTSADVKRKFLELSAGVQRRHSLSGSHETRVPLGSRTTLNQEARGPSIDLEARTNLSDAPINEDHSPARRALGARFEARSEGSAFSTPENDDDSPQSNGPRAKRTTSSSMSRLARRAPINQEINQSWAEFDTESNTSDDSVDEENSPAQSILGKRRYSRTQEASFSLFESDDALHPAKRRPIFVQNSNLNEMESDELEFEESVFFENAEEIERAQNISRIRAHILRGKFLSFKKNNEKAIIFLKKALKALDKIDNVNLRAQALICLGNARYEDSEHKNEFWYLEALGLLGSGGDVNLRVQALIGLGNARYQNEGARWYLEALGLLGEDGKLKLRAQALIGLGHARYKNEQARWYLEALDLLGSGGDVNLRALALIGLGNARYEDSNPNREHWFLKVLDLLGLGGDVNLRAQALIGLGNAKYNDLRDISHYTQIEGVEAHASWFLEALRLLGEDSDMNLRVQALIGLGNARYEDSNHNREDWFLKAIGLLGEGGDVHFRAQALIGLGHARYNNSRDIFTYAQFRDLTTDVVWFLEALRLLGPDNDVNVRAQALIGLGNVRYTDQEHKKDLFWYLEALDLLGPDGDVNLRAQALIGLGNARYTDQEHKKDLFWYLEALHLLGSRGDVNLRVQALIGLGHAGYQNAQARWYLEALCLLGPDGDVNLRVQAFIGLGNARYNNSQDIFNYTQFSHVQRGAAWYLQALCLLNPCGGVNLRAQALIGLGNDRYNNSRDIVAYTQFPELKTNAAWYLEALNLLGPDGDVNLRAQALIGLGNARYNDSRIITAYTQFPEMKTNAVWYLEVLDLLGLDGDVNLRAQALIGLGNARHEDYQHKREFWYLEALRLLGNDRGPLSKKAWQGLENARFDLRQAEALLLERRSYRS